MQSNQKSTRLIIADHEEIITWYDQPISFLYFCRDESVSKENLAVVFQFSNDNLRKKFKTDTFSYRVSVYNSIDFSGLRKSPLSTSRYYKF